MKQTITLLAVSAFFISSCNTAYKTGQTPDDVYFSPARPQAEYVVVNDREDRYNGDEPSGDYYTDRYLRMRINDRNRWSVLDDYYFTNSYAYNSFGYGGSNWNSPWNSYYTWNNYYNPYYQSNYYSSGLPYYYPGAIIIKNTTSIRPPSRPVAFTPSSYTGNGNSNTNTRSYRGTNSASYYTPGSTTPGRYNNGNSNTGRSTNYSNSSRNNDNYNSNSNSTPSRSYTPSSSSSSNSSSSGRSSTPSAPAPSSRPPR